MAKSITTAKAREDLQVRREPHWRAIRRGCWLGFRKMSKSGEGTWRARFRESGSTTRSEVSLGDFGHLPHGERYVAALKAAEAWFGHMGAGGRNEPITVKEACAAYVAHLQDEGREKTAIDAKGRFKRWIDSDPIGKVELQKLTHPKVVAWRKNLAKTQTLPQDKEKKGKRKPRSASSLNRDMAALRAALNQAVKDRQITSNAAWCGALEPVKGADGRRMIYLSSDQRKALLEAAQPDLRPFLMALCLLPLRPGAMAALTVADFDRQLKVLRIGKDKSGEGRRIGLPDNALPLFTAQTKDKLPAAPLFNRADGSAWNKDAWKKPFREAATAAMLPAEAVTYALRHSTITDLLALHGLDVMTVCRIAGTGLEMIQKNYGHLLADKAKEALEKLALQ